MPIPNARMSHPPDINMFIASLSTRPVRIAASPTRSNCRVSLWFTLCYTAPKKRGPAFRQTSFPSTLHRSPLIPAQGSAGLVFNHPRLEKVLLLLEIDHLRHPRERIVGLVEQRIDADLLAAAVRDEAQVLLEHRCIQTQHAARHGVLG